MNTLTGAALGGLLGATNIKVGDLSKNQKIAILALAGAVLVNMHKKLYADPMHKPTPGIEASKFKDERRA